MSERPIRRHPAEKDLQAAAMGEASDTSSQQSASVERHLLKCAECRDSYETYRQLAVAFDVLSEPPTRILERVLRANRAARSASTRASVGGAGEDWAARAEETAALAVDVRNALSSTDQVHGQRELRRLRRVWSTRGRLDEFASVCASQRAKLAELAEREQLSAKHSA